MSLWAWLVTEESHRSVRCSVDLASRGGIQKDCGSDLKRSQTTVCLCVTYGLGMVLATPVTDVRSLNGRRECRAINTSRSVE